MATYDSSDMTEPGLRERKKAEMRSRIADTAARLFGEHGYDEVGVADVARAAGVAEQTVYNYFPTKRDLLLDRSPELVRRYAGLVRERAPGTSPAAALRDAARAEVARRRDLEGESAAGELPVLAARSPAIRRLALEAFDRYAVAVAEAIVATTPGVEPLAARAHAAALMAVFQYVFEIAGARRLAGVPGAAVADELAPRVEAALDDLDRRFGGPFGDAAGAHGA